MRDLSIFVDESGDFGPYDYRAPYYIVTLVLHDQASNITDQIAHFTKSLSDIGMKDHIIHAGPLIRREEVYTHMTIDERIRVFNRAFNFTRSVDVSYKAFIVEKCHINDSLELVAALSKQMSQFLNANYCFFTRYERILIYYDNGQTELTKILITIFHTLFSNVEHRQAKPSAYRLLQVADIICTLELCGAKAERKALSKSETSFFRSGRDLKKNYLKSLKKKEFGAE